MSIRCDKNCSSEGKSMKNKNKQNKNCNEENKTILLTSALENAHEGLSTSGNAPPESSTQQSTNNNNMNYDKLLTIHEPGAIPNNTALQTISRRDLELDYIIKCKELENITKLIELQIHEFHCLKSELQKLLPSNKTKIGIKMPKPVLDYIQLHGSHNFYLPNLEAYKKIPPITEAKPLNHSEDLFILFCQKIVSLFITVMAEENSQNENFLCNNCCKLHVDEKRMLALKSLQSSITGPKSSTLVKMFSLCANECKEELIGVLDKQNKLLDFQLKLISKVQEVLMKKLKIEYEKEIMNNKFEKLVYEIELCSGQKCPKTSYLSRLIKQRDNYIKHLNTLDHKFSNLNLDFDIENEIKSFNDFLVQHMDIVKKSDITSVNKSLSEHKECATQSFIPSENLNSDINDNGKNIKANEVMSNYKFTIKDLSTLAGETNQSSEDTFDFEELD